MNHTKIICPRCHERLELVHVSTVGVEGCRRCGGVWIGPKVTAQLFDGAHTGALLAADEMDLEARWVVDTRENISCPECRSPMDRLYVEGAAVELDQCRQHGVWFDREELVRIARWRERNGKNKILGVVGSAALGAATISTTVREHHERSRSSLGDVEDAIDAVEVTWDVAEMTMDAAEEIASASGDVAIDAVATVGHTAAEVGGSALDLVFGLLGAFLE